MIGRDGCCGGVPSVHQSAEEFEHCSCAVVAAVRLGSMRQGGGKGATMPISVSMTRRWVGPKSRWVTRVEVLEYYFVIQEDLKAGNEVHHFFILFLLSSIELLEISLQV